MRPTTTFLALRFVALVVLVSPPAFYLETFWGFRLTPRPALGGFHHALLAGLSLAASLALPRLLSRQ